MLGSFILHAGLPIGIAMMVGGTVLLIWTFRGDRRENRVRRRAARRRPSVTRAASPGPARAPRRRP